MNPRRASTSKIKMDGPLFTKRREQAMLMCKCRKACFWFAFFLCNTVLLTQRSISSLLRYSRSVKYLVENGADKNELTGVGESALWWAKKELGNDNPVVELLEDMGALEMGPDL